MRGGRRAGRVSVKPHPRGVASWPLVRRDQAAAVADSKALHTFAAFACPSERATTRRKESHGEYQCEQSAGHAAR
ncbi:hypothetical protein O1611_g8975 [Lasiodiplodia mahajangana]|uniref:Uncharacterized protein n=1 Tax=Lasiodiplodia mahajangana TaxID=1108764 RepID=A0ACC2JBA9_9PEZI|nr:hypothetical protein O1611_g8975 [Lasiodiplodia mahajangana]